ncbi:MAG: site-specific integrase [Tetragenococcus sp.]|nr:site-specific integrase [Tetragenococcus sp.]MDN6663593.1 site-specific integrase [Tetragenococcus koreensis]
MWMEELPNGKFTYRERYKDPYTEKYKKVSITLNSKSNQAKNKAQKKLNEKIEKQSKKVNRKDLTFEQLYKQYKPIYQQNVRDSTFHHFESCYRVVTTWFDEKSIVRNIDSNYLQTCLDNFYYKKNYSYSYAISLKSFVSNVLSYGQRVGACEFNAMDSVSIKEKQTELAKKDEEKYLEDSELKLLLEEIRNWPKVPRKYRYAEILELMSLTGMRFGEAAALKEEDFSGKTLRIDESLYYNYGNLEKGETNKPKNKFSNRVISLSDRTVEILEKWIEENHANRLLFDGQYHDMSFLFCDHLGIPIGISPINRILRNIRVKLKNEGKIDKDVTSHYFRHTHISKLTELGIPLKSIMDRVGHANPKTTLQIYTHVTKKMDQQLINKLNEAEKED